MGAAGACNYTMAELTFTESMRSPLHKSRTRCFSPLDKSPSVKCEVVGSMSAVNAQISHSGLKGDFSLRPLVSDIAMGDRHPPPARKDQHDHTDKKKGEEEEQAALVELAKFPGYSQSRSTPLPRDINTLSHLKLVTAAQLHLKTKPTFKKYWEQIFYSSDVQTIFLDMFWWYFIHRYQPELNDIQDCLFTRVSDCYIQILTDEEENAQKRKNVFLKLFPDALAQSIYSGFIHAFPTSWNSFDEQFRSDLSIIISLWFTGTKCQPDMCKWWNMRALEPKNLMKVCSTDSNSSSEQSSTGTASRCKSRKLGFNLDDLLREADQLAEEEASKRERVEQSGDGEGSEKGERGTGSETDSITTEAVKCSNKPTGPSQQPPVRQQQAQLHANGATPQHQEPKKRETQKLARLKEETSQTLTGPGFEHVVFDIFGKSPLVQHFLNRSRLIYHCGYSRLLSRTEIVQLPPPDSTTYSDVLKSSYQHSRETKAQFDKCYFSLKESMAKCERERRDTSLRHQKEVSLLLSNTKELKRLGYKLTLQLQDEKLVGKKQREIINKEIANSLKRLST